MFEVSKFESDPIFQENEDRSLLSMVEIGDSSTAFETDEGFLDVGIETPLRWNGVSKWVKSSEDLSVPNGPSLCSCLHRLSERRLLS